MINLDNHPINTKKRLDFIRLSRDANLTVFVFSAIVNNSVNSKGQFLTLYKFVFNLNDLFTV